MTKRLPCNTRLPPVAMLVPKGDIDLGDLYCHRGHVTYGSKLLWRTMSGSMVLPKPGSVFMPMIHSSTKGHTDAQGLGHQRWPCGYPRALWPRGPCRSRWFMLPLGTMKSKGHMLSFGPAPRWLLQLETWPHPSWKTLHLGELALTLARGGQSR